MGYGECNDVGLESRVYDWPISGHGLWFDQELCVGFINYSVIDKKGIEAECITFVWWIHVDYSNRLYIDPKYGRMVGQG